MSKPNPAPAAKADSPSVNKSKKMLIIIIAAIALLGGGAATYFFMKPAHNPTNGEGEVATEESHPAATPVYVALGTFTANLIHEEGDRYLQVAISIKISNPDLEEKIKTSNPEILHYVNMLLQSKGPTELATLEGKNKLASDLKTQIEQVLGLNSAGHNPAQSVSAPIEVKSHRARSGIEEVLFTSFIIQ